jgi:DnaJ like chaperone protein
MNPREYFTRHQRFGKIIGAILGFIMAGPFGAFLGLFIGNFFDKGLAEHFSKPNWSFRTEHRESVRRIFLHATFSVMGHLAKADGRITEDVISMAKQIMHDMGLSKKQKETSQAFFNEGKQPQFNLSAILTELKTIAHDNPELLKLFIELQYRAAQVNGISSRKLNLLNEIFSQMGLAPLHTQSRYYNDFFYRHSNQHQYTGYQYNQGSQNHRNQGTLDEAYALLKLSPNAKQDEIKRTYRRLMSQNHPDKLMSKGATEEEIKTANEKTQAIRRAYEQICENKGW